MNKRLTLFAANRANRKIDVAVTSGSAIGVSVPNFWLALVMVTLFAINWRLLPARGFVSFGVLCAFVTKRRFPVSGTQTIANEVSAIT